ncbi:hypothetical protein NLI96_g12083 [Meripilus lineatus]|uniref:CxC1-like cysteine cluster associated with KDZ transposases domain-containing protein n=1 Tax=Meripilus lineatus TaxID=2056292 RepID=A0AAD5UQI8_9APHY|nr:hypothetical protein NLI96_g12083 [Physisporinus lineatus]
MSARRPKFSPSKSKRKAQKAVPPGSSNLLLLSEAPRTRLPPATAHLAIPRHQTILALPVRKSYVQIQRPRTAQTRHINSEDPSVADNDTFQNDFTNIIFQHSLEDSPNTNAQKRQRQWRQWQLHTIPSLVQPYLDILRKTQSLREKPLLCEPPRCTCMKSRVIKVLCVYFERIEQIELAVCTCAPAAVQLLQRALFPCAPLYPTLAVDLSLLDFVKRLFLRLPPNVSGWCETLEDFLDYRGYRLETQVRPKCILLVFRMAFMDAVQEGIRRRFANALRWYTVTVIRTEELVRCEVDNQRPSRHTNPSRNPQLIPEPSSDNDSSSARLDSTQTTSEPVSLESSTRQSSSEPPSVDRPSSPSNTMQSPNRDSTGPEVLARPSLYLQRRCPLCFGGLGGHTPGPDPDAIICCDANFTQKCRKGQIEDDTWPWSHPDTVFITEDKIKEMEKYVEERRAGPRRAANQDTSADSCEDGMLVPNSVLDGCQESFKAADEKREKASTQFFRDTGLMAMLCRHDRVLFLANMTSAGEKQHYVLALIKELFSHLPPDITIADLFCQHHQRLLVLDEQVKYLDNKSLDSLAAWLLRRWTHCLELKREADNGLNEIDFAVDVLRREWNAQVVAQTKPAPKRSQRDGEKAVEEILGLKQLIESYRSEEVQLSAELLVGNNVMPMSETQEKLSAIRKIRIDTEERVKILRNRLSVDGRLDLARLIKDKYLQRRMNARTLKMRILQRLRERKFELEQMQHSYRNVLNDKKLANHIRSATKRRDPTIQKLTKTYNSLVAEIETMIRDGKAPRGARAPRLINSKGLFSLDVDDVIWDDDRDDPDWSAPLWQYNEDLRRGIRLLLQCDRCEEEEKRLQKERSSIQEWFVEEWQSTQKAIEAVGNNPAVEYQLKIYANRLLPLNWGMSDTEFGEGLIAIASGCFKVYGDVDEDVDDDVNEDCSEGDEDDAAFMEELETHAFGYTRPSDNLQGNYYESVEFTDGDPSQSPRKRSRVLE